jgi:hypothetical protein
MQPQQEGVRMTVADAPTIAGARKAAGIWTLVEAVRNRWRTRGCRRTRPIPGADDTDWLKHVRGGAVPDPGPQRQAEPVAFHASPAVFVMDEHGCPGWGWREIENPDLADDWRTYEDWLPTTIHLN